MKQGRPWLQKPTIAVQGWLRVSASWPDGGSDQVDPLEEPRMLMIFETYDCGSERLRCSAGLPEVRSEHIDPFRTDLNAKVLVILVVEYLSLKKRKKWQEKLNV
jgi:hypothetical protein